MCKSILAYSFTSPTDRSSRITSLFHHASRTGSPYQCMPLRRSMQTASRYTDQLSGARFGCAPGQATDGSMQSLASHRALRPKRFVKILFARSLQVGCRCETQGSFFTALNKVIGSNLRVEGLVSEPSRTDPRLGIDVRGLQCHVRVRSHSSDQNAGLGDIDGALRGPEFATVLVKQPLRGGQRKAVEGNVLNQFVCRSGV